MSMREASFTKGTDFAGCHTMTDLLDMGMKATLDAYSIEDKLGVLRTAVAYNDEEHNNSTMCVLNVEQMEFLRDGLTRMIDQMKKVS